MHLRPWSVLLLAAFLAPPAASAKPKTSGPWAVTLVGADGHAFVRWSLPERRFPANGFRLERVDGGRKSLVATVVPGKDADAIRTLPADEAQMVSAYRKAVEDPTLETDAKKKQDFSRIHLGMTLRTLADPALTAFLGLSFEDSGAPKGATVSYVISAIGADGSVTLYAQSEPVKIVPMPPPDPPRDVTAQAARGHVQLFFTPVLSETNPAGAVTYTVLRRDARGGKPETVSPTPLFVNQAPGPGPKVPAFVDNDPAPEKTSFYSVVPRDLFGHPGPESALAEVFVPDFTANQPPDKVSAVSGPGHVTVTWDAKKNPNTLGYLVSRSLGQDGPYFLVTAEPVAAPPFTDSTGKPGTSYYYTVTSVNKRKEPGDPSRPATSPFLGAKPPDPPAELTAERKTGLIVLRWKEADASSLQGYRVERDAGDGQWAILTSVPTLDDRFDDQLPADTLGTMSYRVVAVGLDGQVSAPSVALKVPLPKTRPPARPEIVSIDGRNGQVSLEFRGSGEKNEANAFLVLRSTSTTDDGIVVHDAPLPKTATTFTDPDVTAGSDYLYRVVTLDDAGNRSEPSEAARVRVGSKALAALPAPKLSYQTKPYPRVVAEFAPPADPSARAVLERKELDGSWRTLTGPIPYETTRAIDSHPPKARKVLYRLSVVSANGVPGPASPAAEIQLP